jgi:hypothetical protein
MAKQGLHVPLGLVALTALALCAACGSAQENKAVANSGAAEGAAELADIPVLRPQPLAIDPPLGDRGERRNLSGAACDPDGVCLMIGDEKRYARLFTIAGGVLIPGDAVHIFADPAGCDGDIETDAEGIAYADGAFYVVGSHSRNKDGEHEESRHFLYRITLDPGTHRPADLGTCTAPSRAVTRVGLDPIIRAHPLLFDHRLEPPGETRDDRISHGTNIEGIAIADGNMLIGFRGPVDGQGAVILRAPLAGLFGGSPTAAIERVPLGDGRGVRDLVAVTGGFLILAGPESRLPAPNPEIFLWRPNSHSAPISLGRLPVEDARDSPEAIALIAETDREYRVLVLADGKAEGAPAIYGIAKPNP